MSNGLTLPFAGTLDSDKQVFQITQPARGGVAIWAFSGGVKADGSPGVGVSGTSYSGGTGVSGISDTGPGLHGHSERGEGVHAEAKGSMAAVAAFNLSPGQGQGVWAHSDHGAGVHAETKGNVAAVEAFNFDPGQGQGVWAHSDHGAGVHAETKGNVAAVEAFNFDPGQGQGIWAESQHGEGVHGVSHGGQAAGVAGINDAGGIGIYGAGGQYAGLFDGNHQVNGNSECNGDHHVSGTVRVDVDVVLKGGDCAEQFTVSPLTKSEPGTVMVINEGGDLEPSRVPYDRKVAGVVSGAGGLKPGIILDKQGSGENRVSVALLGKVYCKVDAECARVEVGDLLTTSPNPGHAMKADDPAKAFGAVIGKALGSLRSGRGLIPILIALQ